MVKIPRRATSAPKTAIYRTRFRRLSRLLSCQRLVWFILQLLRKFGKSCVKARLRPPKGGHYRIQCAEILGGKDQMGMLQSHYSMAVAETSKPLTCARPIGRRQSKYCSRQRTQRLIGAPVRRINQLNGFFDNE